MPILAQTLPTNDIGFLRIVASLWGIELTSSDPAEAAVELGESLCDAELLEEVVSTLSKDGRAALDALTSEDGRMPWVVFARRFGDLREMGPGKRDREQPHLQPSSATEILWYRALLAKAFFNTEKGPQEFAFIPDDLFMALDFAGLIPAKQDAFEQKISEAGPSLENIKVLANMPEGIKNKGEIFGRPASPAEKNVPVVASDRILDDACTFLAGLRMNLPPVQTEVPAVFLRGLLGSAGLLARDELNPEAVKSFLESPRDKALQLLRESWQNSEVINELRQLPGLVFEGDFDNQPFVTREFLLSLLQPVPDGQWWSLASFIRDVKAKYPDFQRPAGDYDSWFIKRESDGQFLRGFSSWEEVDGALLRFYICGPLHWLGMLDLAYSEGGVSPSAFRSTPAPQPGESFRASASESGRITVSSQGKIIVPRMAPRAVRYQVARFCEWDAPREQDYSYRVTALSLKKAKEQGLKSDHLIGLLRKHASNPPPPALVKALQRWDQNGTEARVENLVVLKVSRPDVLNELRASPAGRFLGEILGPTAVVVQAGAQARVLSAMAEMGILAEGIVLE